MKYRAFTRRLIVASQELRQQMEQEAQAQACGNPLMQMELVVAVRAFVEPGKTAAKAAGRVRCGQVLAVRTLQSRRLSS